MIHHWEKDQQKKDFERRELVQNSTVRIENLTQFVSYNSQSNRDLKYDRSKQNCVFTERI